MCNMSQITSWELRANNLEYENLISLDDYKYFKLYIDFGYDFECKRCNKCGEYLSTLESFEEHILMFHFKEAICLKDF